MSITLAVDPRGYLNYSCFMSCCSNGKPKMAVEKVTGT